ncbi:hypothetical protein [Streptomyces sp. NPDC057413]|uniref:hypothetical protein n=1 Tax=Streptomyces sp. NPDC057413 TaxID=3346124 RepID=UPI0036938821
MTDTPKERSLTKGQAVILGAATLPMIAFGILGAWGTYTNIKAVFPRSATALGVVAAGEGATFVLALVFVGLTMLGQSSPRAVRVGLWLLPAAASGTGAIVAQGATEAVVYALTPMAMCVSAEGMGLLARRIVVHRTGVDMEAQRRNAETMQRLAVTRALAANHPWRLSRKRAELKSWRLAKKVGTGDVTLGAGLVTVQRERMTEGADAALAAMFGAASVTPALTASVTPALPGAPVRAGSGTAADMDDPSRDDSGTAAVTDGPARHATGTADTQGATATGTQVSDGSRGQSSATVTDSVTPAVTETGTDGVTETVTETGPVTGAGVTDETPSRESAGVTLEQIAAVAGVPVPVPGERLTDAQLEVVLRHLRYADDPPLSYRQATASFRSAGFVGSEERVRRVWGALMSKEEETTDTEGTEASAEAADTAEEETEEEPEGA